MIDLCLQLPQSGQVLVAEGADLVVLHVEQAELAAVAQVGQPAQAVALQLTESMFMACVSCIRN